MNNKEYYRNTFDHIRVSDEMLKKLKMMENNKKIIQRNGYMKYAMAILVVLLFVGSNAVCYAATGKNLYTFVVNSSIIQDFFHAENNTQIANQIIDNASYVENQRVVYENYVFNLYRYYSENNSGNILAEFYVTDLEGKQLSDKGMEQLDFNAGLDNGSNHFKLSVNPQMNGSMNTEVYRDKDGNAIIAFRCMVALLGPEDTKVNTNYVDNITELVLDTIDKEGRCTQIGIFKTPANPTKLDSITFDVMDSPKCEYAVISPIGMQFVFNINIAKEELAKELEDSGIINSPDYDPEEHGYTLFKDIVIHMNDGIEYIVIQNGMLYQEEDALVPVGFDSGHHYEYSTGLEANIFGFGHLLDISQVNYLEIDGKQYYVQK